MTKGLATTCNVLAAVCSAVAAYYWFRASEDRELPSALMGFGGAWMSRTQPATPNTNVNATPLVEYMKEGAKRNKVAAQWSGAAAAFAGLGSVLSGT